jgi:hypothetical protein
VILSTRLAIVQKTRPARSGSASTVGTDGTRQACPVRPAFISCDADVMLVCCLGEAARVVLAPGEM